MEKEAAKTTESNTPIKLVTKVFKVSTSKIELFMSNNFRFD